MIKYVMAHDAVSEPVAVSRLELQGRAGPIIGRLVEALGSRYGGVWFDSATGRFEVGVVGGSAQASPARPYLESQGISSETDFVPVKYSAEELVVAKERLATKLHSLVLQDQAATSETAQGSAVIIELASNLSEGQVEQVQAEAKAESVKVEVISKPQEDFVLTPSACVNRPWGAKTNVLACTRDLRGGVAIESSLGLCSLGFFITSGSTEYVMTAGHCLQGGAMGSTTWNAASTNWTELNEAWQSIGPQEGYYIGAEGDVGFIKLNTTSKWYPVNNPSQVASLDPSGPWGQNEDQSLENISWSAEGDVLCHTGTSSDTTCGEVPRGGLNHEAEIEPGIIVKRLALSTMCAKRGDSGGTVWGNHSGFGMTDAIGPGNTNTSCENDDWTYYTEAIQDLWYTGKGSLKFYVPPYGETY
jgi:hypothetical protein